MTEVKINSRTMEDIRLELNDVGLKVMWCTITPLFNDVPQNIYMATFEDDYRIIFEVNEEETMLHLMLTIEQEHVWNDDLTGEEKLQNILSILYYWLSGRREGAV